MRACLDACVLYPTVMRAVLIGAARAGLYEPVWSARILEEWRRAAARRGEDPALVAGEIAVLRSGFPRAEAPSPGMDAWLPDPDDVHVLSAAVAGGCDTLVTANLKDFPTRVLSAHGLVRRDPDGLAAEWAVETPATMGAVAADVLRAAQSLPGGPWTPRTLFRKARMPRFAKAVERAM